MTTVSNIWIICLELNWFVYDSSWMLQLSEFIWTLRSSAWVVLNNFILKDATDRSKISSEQKRLFIAVSLISLSIFRLSVSYFPLQWSLPLSLIPPHCPFLPAILNPPSPSPFPTPPPSLPFPPLKDMVTSVNSLRRQI